MVMIVSERMLVREQESSWAYTALPKDFAVVVELVESVVKGSQRIFSEGILMRNIAEV